MSVGEQRALGVTLVAIVVLGAIKMFFTEPLRPGGQPPAQAIYTLLKEHAHGLE